MAKLIKGVNDLATVNPELAKEWHPFKNEDLKPTEITVSSSQKVWWLLSYDTEDGKHFDFEWQATVVSRNNGMNCPFLSGKAIWQGFNDLATMNPELAKEWHPTKNGNLKAENITVNSSQKVWWLLPYDDANTGKHFDFEWQARVADRNDGSKCPFLTGHKIWQGFNDLATTNPELARQWHPTKNGDLKPTNVTCGCSKKVWWLFPYDDSATGKHYDFEWQANISDRNKGCNCPYLNSSKSEFLLYSILKKENILFKTEKTFNNCRNKNPLPFDIYLPNKNIIIECDGMQHFKPIDYFDGKDGLKKTKYHDNIKNNFCKQNNIPILHIPYIYDPVADKQKIELLVLDFINTKTVPQEILDFYSKYKSNNYVRCATELNNKNLKL